MPKVIINARIPEKLREEVAQEATRRGLTLSKMIENSLIHELNRNSDAGTVHELENIKNAIDARINELKTSNTEPSHEFKSVDDYINELREIQSTRGHVAEGLVKHYAGLSGMTFKEFLNALNVEGVNLLIM